MSSEGGLGILERTDISTQVPSDNGWVTILLNDPVNTFSHVIACCMRIVKCSKEQAQLYANQVHYQGRSVVYHGTQEDAQDKAAQFSAAHIWSRAELAA